MPPPNLPQTLPCLYIPDDSSPNRYAQQRTLVFPPGSNFDDVVCTLFECRYHAVETLYSDDALAMYNGNPEGLPHGQTFTLYEIYMDDNGNATRPRNSLAAQLFARPKSHGPMIVIKMTLTKSEDGELHVVSKDPLTQGELQSAAFQSRREEFSRKKAAHNRSIFGLFKSQGDIVFNLN